MDKVIIDTDIVIDFLRTKSGQLLRIIQFQNLGLLEIFFSSLTIMELYAGEMKKTEMDQLTELLINFKVIPFDQQLAQFAGEKKRGEKFPIRTADFIIGITSVYLGAYLATRNKEHFKGIKGLKFFDLVSLASN